MTAFNLSHCITEKRVLRARLLIIAHAFHSGDIQRNRRSAFTLLAMVVLYPLRRCGGRAQDGALVFCVLNGSEINQGVLSLPT